MEEQQKHLIELYSQRQTILNDLEGLKDQSSQKRDLLLRVEGAIEYLGTIGVTLPEPKNSEDEANVIEEVVEENTES